MYLRNKKTGEVVDWSFVGPTAIKEYEGKDVLLERERYASIEEFISEYEDYKPAEPLIKDEKIRKAVRAWAEANAVKKAEFEYVEGRGSYLKDYFCEVQIEFYDDLELTNRKTYTIAELCGEEDE